MEIGAKVTMFVNLSPEISSANESERAAEFAVAACTVNLGALGQQMGKASTEVPVKEEKLY